VLGCTASQRVIDVGLYRQWSVPLKCAVGASNPARSIRQ
jgi:hypothetical protein